VLFLNLFAIFVLFLVVYLAIVAMYYVVLFLFQYFMKLYELGDFYVCMVPLFLLAFSSLLSCFGHGLHKLVGFRSGSGGSNGSVMYFCAHKGCLVAAWVVKGKSFIMMQWVFVHVVVRYIGGRHAVL